MLAYSVIHWRYHDLSKIRENMSQIAKESDYQMYQYGGIRKFIALIQDVIVPLVS